MRRASRFAMRAAAVYVLLCVLVLFCFGGGLADGSCAVKHTVVVFWALGLPGSIVVAEPLGQLDYFTWAQTSAFCHTLIALPFIATGALQWAVAAALHGLMLDLFDDAARG